MRCLGFDPNEMRPSQHRTLAHQYGSWGQVRVDMVRRTGLKRQETKIFCPGHVFLMNLHGTARNGEDFVDGRRISFSPRRAGSIVFVPAGNDWTGWDEGDETASFLLVSIEQQFAQEMFGEAARHRQTVLPPSIGFRDGLVEMALQRIAIELKQPDPISAAMVESQAKQLLVQMVRLSGAYQERQKGGLSSFDLRRAMEMIGSLSGETLTLAALAKELGLSRFHFSRAFKQSTGKTPHAFIAERRLEKSSGMLRSTSLSATEIALECGFGSSSHFAIAFRQAFGVSPTEYRRMCKL